MTIRNDSATDIASFARRIGFAAALTLVFAAGTMNVRADSVYVGYYHTQTVGDFSLTTGTTTITGGSTFASGIAAEGFQCLMGAPGANPSLVYVVNATTGGLSEYTAGGTLLSSNILKNSSGSTITLNGLAGSALSSDGQTIYLASSTGSNSGIYAFNTLTGKETGHVSFNDAHDVTFHNGYLYASAYESTNASSQGVYRFNADLSNKTQIIAGGDNNLYHATGMAFVGNNLYVGNAGINSSTHVASFVSEYTLSGTTATFDQKFTSSTAIDNPFGVTAGPDGNVYIASLGNLSSDKGQVTELDVSTGNLSTYISYGDYGVAGQAPKYVSFSSECTMYSVPEPSPLTMLTLGGACLGFGAWVRRRRAAVAIAS